jgi:hypothetical protein
VLPWLITTTAWPALAAHVAGATARALVDPVVLGGVTAGAVAIAVTLWRCGPGSAPAAARPELRSRTDPPSR